MSNWGLRLLSLVIAVLLSIYVNSENNITSARVVVGVEVRDLPDDKIVIWHQKKQVEVEVRGPSFLVSRISASPPTLRVKLPDEVGAKFTAQINKSDFNIEPPVQIVSIEPAQIPLSIDKKIKKDLPVKVLRSGQLPDDLKLGEISVAPETVSVTGPESELKDIQSISTSAIDLKEIRATDAQDVSLKIPGKFTELARTAVKVRIVVNPINIHRTFESIPVELRISGHDGIRIAPETVSVTVLATKDIADTLTASSVIPYIRIGQGTIAGMEEIPVQVEVPSGATVVSTIPEKVKIIHQAVKKKG